MQELAEEREPETERPQAQGFPAGAFRPGTVVWAKVEGHDWWPARVVRRRAVPREVGPPPGGQEQVRIHIPCVFFTAQGIPGEFRGSDSVEAAMAAAVHAPSSNGDPSPPSASSLNMIWVDQILKFIRIPVK
jgi:hypothetical protein